MQLTSLELTGFKSFPGFTRIQFDAGMTAIVGPNGSGKSNITDAIRWVLGEQSLKVLRGKKMEDLIFAGTQDKRQMGYAEVSLLFDNKEGKAALPYEEIRVTRRIYRSGESVYEINRQTCRLKDIQSLFWDTGIGKDGYAIISQGKVDELLSSKSEDRRKVFDEASGISKYRHKKEESQRKLSLAEDNLSRVEDILNEIHLQLKPMESQAKVAEAFLHLEEERKSLALVLCMEKITQAEEALHKYQEDLQALQDSLEEEDRQQELFAEQERSFRDERQRLETKEEELRKEELSLLRQNQELLAQVNLFAQEKLHIQERLDALKLRLVQVQSQEKKWKEDIEQRRQKTLTLEKQKAKYEKTLNERENILQEKIQGLDERQKKIEGLRQKLLDLQDEYYEAKTQHSEILVYLRSRQEQERRHAKERLQTKSKVDSLNLEKEEREDAFKLSSKGFQEAEKTYQDEQEKLEDKRKSLIEVEERLQQEEQNYKQAHYQYGLLKQLNESYEGYTFAVKALLTSKKLGHSLRQAVKGTVAELLSCEERYSLALEVALGSALQHIVVDKAEEAKELVAFLKHEKLGRATFLPLQSLSARTCDRSLIEQARKCKGFLGVASTCVQCKKGQEILAENLLGRCLFVDTLEHAIQVSERLGHKLKVVSLEGDVLQAGGSITGGSMKQDGSKLLRRVQDLEKLAQALPKLENHLAEIKRERDKKEEELQEIAEAVRLSYEAKQEKEVALKKKEQALMQIEQEYRLWQEKQIALEKDEKLEEENTKTQQDRAQECSKQADLLQKTMAELRRSIQGEEEENQQELLEREDLREEIADLKFNLHSMQEALQSTYEWLEKLAKETDHSEEDQKCLVEEENRLKTQLEELEKKETLRKDRVKILEEKKKQQGFAWENLKEEQKRLEEKQTRYEEQVKQEQERFMQLQISRSRLQERVERGREQGDLLKAQLWEEHRLTYLQCEDEWERYQNYLKQNKVGDKVGEKSLGVKQTTSAQATETTAYTDLAKTSVSPYEQLSEKSWLKLYKKQDATKVNKRLQFLKQEIEKLGPVNLAAIETAKELKERKNFLDQQQKDILLAKEELEKIIQHLHKEMRLRFVESFEQINKHFSETFQDLFGGGKAELILEDKHDILHSPIEVRVCPPGKKLQNMLLLSGGEKALSAIALLFAILKFSPSPFVILDEIEAALDEANVFRFAETVRKYAQDSQFILVTHRKGTMEACDRIYGVTMQEKGVSRVLSLKLSEQASEE